MFFAFTAARRFPAVAAAGLLAAAAAVAQPPEPPPDPTPPGVEVLTRGPIHEAFAGPAEVQPQAPVAVPTQPPEILQEAPPAQKPSGDVVWIPGYWGWDDDRKDYLWVSGVWRDPPPRHTWVPGYWTPAAGGFQFVSGFWQPAAAPQLQYVAAPPALVVAPSLPQPGPNYYWIPPCYVYRNAVAVSQRGFWSPYQQGWVWVPATYRWTPYGYLYCAGHWDLDLESRGCCFAPVYIDRPRFGLGFYTPGVVLNVGCVTAHLFCRPRCGCYYFGDYYDTAYVGAGYVPWFQATSSRVCYDPLFAYYSCHYQRTNPGWGTTLALNFDLCRRDVSYRPARTLVQQNIVVNNFVNVHKTVNVNNVVFNNVVNNNGILSGNAAGRLGAATMALPLSQVARNNQVRNVSFTTLDGAARNAQVVRTQSLRDASVARAGLERQAFVGAGTGAGKTGPAGSLRQLTIPDAMRSQVIQGSANAATVRTLANVSTTGVGKTTGVGVGGTNQGLPGVGKSIGVGGMNQGLPGVGKTIGAGGTNQGLPGVGKSIGTGGMNQGLPGVGKSIGTGGTNQGLSGGAMKNIGAAGTGKAIINNPPNLGGSTPIINRNPPPPPTQRNSGVGGEKEKKKAG